tara:strand:+ start:351 stop:671 length:321 start_codon:yes stop_codon:yes gene_type:complete
MLQEIKEKIENMNKLHQIEILRIFNKNQDTVINSNQNGSFINLSNVPENIIQEICKYLKYVDEQSIEINIVETKKDEYKEKFFSLSQEIDNKNENGNILDINKNKI